jgi:hypothetical protein
MELEKIPPLRFIKGDRARLESYYPTAGVTRIVRMLVHKHLAKLDAKFEQRIAARGLSMNEARKLIDAGIMEQEPVKDLDL